MTAHEALWLMKAQLQKNDQNLEAVKVLEDIVKSVNRLRIDHEETLEDLFTDYEGTYTLDEVYGTEAEHIRNHMTNIGVKDLQELEPNMCARYDWAEDDEIVKFYDLCGDSNEDS
jgi:hypothetical protein